MMKQNNIRNTLLLLLFLLFSNARVSITRWHLTLHQWM